jgi:hypothetical protein
MNATEQLAAEAQSSKHGSALMKTPPIPVTVSPSGTTPPCWKISPDPIRLEHDDDTVFWDLTKLMATYNQPGTLFEIEFWSGPVPARLDRARGPFTTLHLTGNRFDGQLRNHDFGSYVYNLYVTEPGRNRQRMTIDPQVDNVAPPPPPPTIGEPPEVPDPEDAGRRAEH